MKFSGHHPMTKWAEMFEDDTIYWVRSGELVDQISDPMKSGVGPRSCTVSPNPVCRSTISLEGEQTTCHCTDGR